jgi:predicted Fe-Mo cluster-binding NifX family protein
MKICITSDGNIKDSNADLRFGRCKYFGIYDDRAEELNFIMNPGVESIQGAGITAAQKIIDMGVSIVITGNMGPNAMKLLNASGIKVYGFQKGTIEEVIKSYMDKDLTEITTPVAPHFGMGSKGGRG